MVFLKEIASYPDLYETIGTDNSINCIAACEGSVFQVLSKAFKPVLVQPAATVF